MLAIALFVLLLAMALSVLLSMPKRRTDNTMAKRRKTDNTMSKR
jgi:hypothetical protein